MSTTYMDAVTELTERERRSYIYFFASLSSNDQLTVMGRQAEIINLRRREMTKGERTEFYLACLVLATRDFKVQIQKAKRRMSTPAELAAVDRQRLDYLKRQNCKTPDRDFLIRHLSLLRQLRGEGFSWRMVREYLRRYLAQDISINYIRKVYYDLSLEE